MLAKGVVVVAELCMNTKEIVMTCVRYFFRTEEDHDEVHPFGSGDMLECFMSALRDMLSARCYSSDLLSRMFHSSVCRTSNGPVKHLRHCRSRSNKHSILPYPLAEQGCV